MWEIRAQPESDLPKAKSYKSSLIFEFYSSLYIIYIYRMNNKESSGSREGMCYTGSKVGDNDTSGIMRGEENNHQTEESSRKKGKVVECTIRTKRRIDRENKTRRRAKSNR